jgi:hypothetical protein
MTYAERIGTILTGLVMKYYPQPRFGKFLLAEQIKYDIIKAAKRKEEQFPELVASYLSAAFLFPRIIFKNLRWDLSLLLFSLISNKSSPKMGLPLLKPSKQKDEKSPWDYEGRGYALYIHIIASAYGWTEKEVSNLKLDTALALVQEILTDEQLDREFLWGMSEKSYSYNAKTKVGRAIPLDRPYFMQTEVKAPVKTKILKSLMPVGVGKLAPTENEVQAKVSNLTRGL